MVIAFASLAFGGAGDGGQASGFRRKRFHCGEKKNAKGDQRDFVLPP